MASVDATSWEREGCRRLEPDHEAVLPEESSVEPAGDRAWAQRPTCGRAHACWPATLAESAAWWPIAAVNVTVAAHAKSDISAPPFGARTSILPLGNVPPDPEWDIQVTFCGTGRFSAADAGRTVPGSVDDATDTKATRDRST